MGSLRLRGFRRHVGLDKRYEIAHSRQAVATLLATTVCLD